MPWNLSASPVMLSLLIVSVTSEGRFSLLSVSCRLTWPIREVLSYGELVEFYCIDEHQRNLQ